MSWGEPFERVDGSQRGVGPADAGIGVQPQPVQKGGTSGESRQVLELVGAVVVDRAAAVGHRTAAQRVVRAQVADPRTGRFVGASFAVGRIDAVGQARSGIAVAEKVAFGHLPLRRLVEEAVAGTQAQPCGQYG